ncbi:hypothetical protein CBR_g19316 [Chara braunii]|uniref:Protein kinase domain-containing protein n=1 Tax=Chara braunii TaxID=69332 RepID=A0A388KXL9_CHABU|nr:hypothetical protein CBR_g19316 [Chara braunii]|eukprot:GBG74804.1 hypothetical protein CBR_g19316 [Chara braunii]
MGLWSFDFHGILLINMVWNGGSVVHKNVRSTNIFLERPRENGPWVGKLGNFGVSKKYLLTTDSEVDEEAESAPRPRSGQILATTRIQGLSAYLDPEFGISSRLTTMSDVFSIGVLLLEIITGRQAFDPSREPSDLAGWARNYLDEGWETLRAIIDPALLQTVTPLEKTQILEVSHLAKKCTKRISSTRPRMWKVVEILSGLLDGSPESTEEHARGAGESQDQPHRPSGPSGLDYVPPPPVVIPSPHSLTSDEIQEVESPLQRPRRGRSHQPVRTTLQLRHAAQREDESVVVPTVDPERIHGKTGVLFPDRYATPGSSIRPGFPVVESGSPLGPELDGLGPGPSVRNGYAASLETESFTRPRFAAGLETSPSFSPGFRSMGSGPSTRPTPAAQTLPKQHSSPQLSRIHVLNPDNSDTLSSQVLRTASVGRSIRRYASPTFSRLNESPWNDDSNIDNSETVPSVVPRSAPVGIYIRKDTSLSSNRLNESPWNDE